MSAAVLFVLLPVICAILAMMGFRGRDHVVGIDLGTTYSVIGVSNGNGTVTIIPDELGNLIFPSIVAFAPEGKTFVSHAAQKYLIQDPEHTIYNAKRFIGLKYDNAIVRQETSGYDFHVTSDASSKDVCFQLSLHGHPACVTPVDIGSFVVSHLLAVARGYLHHDQITSAVIAVPADFDATRKAATIEAFHRAGIRVTRVLEEPTAAAVAYGLHKDPAVTYVLVFDFGGGTLDVSLLYIVNESVQLLGSAGDNQLGGSDLDSALSQHLNDVFRDKLGQVILAHHDPNEHDDHDMEPCTTGGIRVIAERLKRTLSHEHKAEATCQLGGQQVTMTMTRLEFETLCQKLLDRTMLPVFQVLEENQMRPDAVDEVVLVGGSSRIPWIQERLTQVFGKSPKNTINPDLAVAYGAARIVD